MCSECGMQISLPPCPDCGCESSQLGTSIRLPGDGPLDYLLLAVQWWAFYLVVSAVASCLTSIVAFNASASRIAKHV